jgi:murein DD-endopeptidase MepM/ murein hydrolase activator NlpD
MQDRKVRMAFFSLGGSSYRQIEMSWLTFVVSLLLFIALLCGLAAAAVWSFSNFYQKRQLADIERDHQRLRENLRLWEQRVRQMAAGVNGVEPQVVDEEDIDELSNTPLPSQAVILDAEDNIDPAISMEAAPANTPGNGLMAVASPATDFLSRLESDFRQNRQIQKEIADRFEKDRGQAEHLPTIGPLIRGHITDMFGNRSDPFHSRTRHHNGIDIGAPYGTEVYSPAAGMVEMVKLK